MRHTTTLSLLFIGVLFGTLCTPSLMASQTNGWSVVVANNAFVARGESDAATPIAMGASVTPGDRISTGEGGTLVLSRGEDLVTMAENSRIEVVDPQPAATTLIAQPYGHVQYHVTKEKVPHFQVDSPLLATVVKGTTFSVDASPQKSSVTVSEGRVEAKNRRTGASSPVGAGQRGTIESRDRGVAVGKAPGKASAAPANNPNPNAADGASNSAGKGKEKEKEKEKDNGKDKDKGNGNGKDKGSSGNSGSGSSGSGNSGNGGGHGKGEGGNGGGKGGGKGKDK